MPMAQGALLVAHYSSNYRPLATIVAKLTKIDALPRAEIQLSFWDGDGQRYACQCRLSMGRHIVGAFERVLIIRLIFRHEMIHDALHVAPNVGVGIFIYRQTARGVFHKNVEQAALRQRLRQVAENLRRHQMATASFSGQPEFHLSYHMN